MATVRAMTWNVQALFGVRLEDESETAAQLRVKLESQAAVTDATQLHVGALQEVSTEAAPIALQAANDPPMRHRGSVCRIPRPPAAMTATIDY